MKIRKVEDTLRAALRELGYDLKINFTKVFGGKSEYYLYLVTKSGNKIIFSNMKDHEKQGAIIGSRLTDENVKEVVEKILNLIK